MKLSQILSLVAVWAFLIGIIAFFGAPLLWLVLSSFDPNASPVFRIPPRPSLINYLSLAKPVGTTPPYIWIINSIIIATSSATLTTVLSLLAAFILTRYKFRGQSAMLTMFVIFRLVPPIVIALPIMILFKMWGLVNSMLGVILALSALTLPFTLLMADGYFRSIPASYEEAALIDGCSKLGAFLRITLPLAAPGLATIWLLAFVNSWSAFIIPLMVISDVWKMPASVGLYFFYGQYGRVDYGRLSAFSILFSIPMVVVFFLTQKYLMKGVSGLVSR